MTTLRQFRMEIRRALGEAIDDAILSDNAIDYHIGLALNKLKKQDLSKKGYRNDVKGGIDMVSTFVVPLAMDTTLEYRYAPLPGAVYDLSGGKGINYVSYYRLGLPPNCPPQVARAQFDATSWRELPMLYADPIQAPSPERPRFIRTVNRLYVFGVDSQMPTVQMGLALSYDPLNTIDIDAELPIPPESLFDLRRLVLSAGNWILLQPQERLLNDGRSQDQGTRKAQAPPAMSVNDQVMTTPSSE